MNFRIFFPGLTVLLITSVNSLGQNLNSIPNQRIITYRTGFYNFYWDNPDSALYYAQKVAADTSAAEYLREMIHENFYSMFHEKIKQDIKKKALENNNSNWETDYKSFFDKCYNTLVKMASDTNPVLANSVEPLLYWVNVELNKQNPEKLVTLVNEFMSTELGQNDLYQNASARYALFIYEAIAENEEQEGLALKLLLNTAEKFSSFQATENVYFSSRSFLEERAWNRFIYSCANNLMANRLIKEHDDINAGVYFKKSFDFSPDITDLRLPNEYSADAYLLCDSTYSYLQTDYLDYLETRGRNNQLLPAYVDLAFKDPITYKGKLKQLYETHFQGDKSFRDFWLEEVNSRLEKAPPVDLQKVGGGSFSSITSKGKWILIDFWGTWCGPCREEHPVLQKFYDNLVSNHENQIALFTIACKDTEEKVKEYMSEHNYSFPVAMSDVDIKEAFNVLGYPTKVLVTPQGNYLQIPFGIDWVNFIKEYASL